MLLRYSRNVSVDISTRFQTLHAQGTYIGAVVEYNPYQNADKNVMLEQNLKNYEFFIEEAASKVIQELQKSLRLK